MLLYSARRKLASWKDRSITRATAVRQTRLHSHRPQPGGLKNRICSGLTISDAKRGIAARTRVPSTASLVPPQIWNQLGTNARRHWSVQAEFRSQLSGSVTRAARTEAAPRNDDSGDSPARHHKGIGRFRGTDGLSSGGSFNGVMV